MNGMDRIALRMLVGDRMKYAGLVAGLFFASLLVNQQASIFTGYANRTESWIRDTAGHDLWVMDEQVEYSDDTKHMVQTTVGRIRSIEGVAWAVPMYKAFLRTRLADGTALNVRVIGLDDASLAGGPREVVDGDLGLLRQDRAVLVNELDAQRDLSLRRGLPGQDPRPLRVGDTLSINEHETVVAGFFRATPEFFWDPVVYTTFSRALAMAPPERKLTTFVLVKLRDDASILDVADRIEAATGHKAMTHDAFAAETRSYVLAKTGILVNFGITIALGIVIGVLVAGQTLYAFVLDHVRHFGTLKAMGASNAVILRMVAVQVVSVGAIGYGIGVGGAAGTGLLFARGGLAFEMSWWIPVFGAVAIASCCLVAGAISALRVMRLEPAVVFKS